MDAPLNGSKRSIRESPLSGGGLSGIIQEANMPFRESFWRLLTFPVGPLRKTIYFFSEQSRRLTLWAGQLAPEDGSPAFQNSLFLLVEKVLLPGLPPGWSNGMQGLSKDQV